MPPFARRLARIFLGVALVGATLLVALVVASRTAPVRDLVRARIVALLGAATDARVELGGIGGTLGTDLVLRDLRLSLDGRTVVRVPRIEIAYALLPLLRREVRLAHVRLVSPRIRAIRVADGWRLPRPRPEGGSRFSVDVRRLEIEDGRIAVALLDGTPVRRGAATALALDAAARFGAGRADVNVASLRFLPRGIALSAVAASGRIGTAPGGAMRISGLEVATARSRFAADGIVEPGRGLDVQARLAPLAAADVRAVVPGSRLVADLRARARARGPWRAIGVAARAEAAGVGTVVARSRLDGARAPTRWAARVRFSDVDPGAVGDGLPRGAVNGEIRARGARLDPAGPLSYRLALGPTELAGRRVDRLALGGHAAHAVHLVHGEAGGPVGALAVHGRLALRAVPAYRVAARWTVARLDAVVPSAPGWATGRLRADGQGVDPDRRAARVDVTLSGGAVHGVLVDRGAAHLALEGRRVAIDGFTLEGRAVRGGGSGTVELGRRTLELAVTAEGDLAAVGVHLGRPLGGRARMSGSARGPFDALAVSARATVDEPAYGSVVADALTGRVDVAGLGGPSATGSAHLDAPGLRVRDGGRRSAGADLEWRRVGGEDRLRLTATATGEERAPQEVALTVVRTDERTRGVLEALTVTAPDGTSWRLASPATFTVDGGVATDGLVVRAGAQRIMLAGRLAFRGVSDASLRFDGLALAGICALGGGPPCAGEVSGRLAVAGAADAPLMTLTARAVDLEVAGVPYGVFDFEARYAERAVRVHSTLHHPRAGELVVDGDVPVDLAWAGARQDLANAPVALTARADALDLTILQALAPRTLRSTAGRLSLRVNVTGPRAAPQVDGELALDAGRAELHAAGVPYEDIRARIVAHGTRIDVTELHARAGDGTADVRGGADLSEGRASAVALTVHLQDFFAVRQQAYEAALSGDLSVAGTLAAPEVSGGLEIERALVRPAALPASGPSIPEDPTIAVVGPPDAVSDEAPPAPATRLADPVRIAVKIEVARNAWIHRTDANIELGGTLLVSKEPFEPVRLSGQIRLLRGWYAFQGRRFTVDQGTITFTGAAPPKPTFDITAVTQTHEYRIEARITGSAEKPTLTLTSDPPLEQADVLSVLLFGKPAQQLGRGQSVALQEQALSLAAGYVMPQLRTSVMDALGLDTLEVEMPQGTVAGRVSAGRYVAEDVFVSLGQEFGTRNAQVVGLEYSISRSVSVRASTSTRGASAVDLFWQYRY